MTGRCDDNPDHYERSRRFRHLIPGWSLQRCETGRAPRHCSWAKPHTTASRSYEKGIDRVESRTRQSEARLVSKVWEDTRQPSSSGQTLASGETSGSCRIPLVTKFGIPPRSDVPTKVNSGRVVFFFFLI
ncbi:hypothetical protein TNCT_432821 [Trichonephila clavata]|uniref:Uncharacterized protein n=1 Tax=Trichonephila clavata TaxID=2740835 RepID=A0A8X6JH85_TRICU|nr:hypothetical protein TNCT_432821 [Trichonephila clavata]